jgi:uncharacterized protein (TIGR03435 family)
LVTSLADLEVRLYGIAVLAALLLTIAPSAQSTAPTFEVASIKPLPADARASFPGLLLQPSGLATAPGISARQLILVAYGLQEVQLVGGPAWLTTDRYAIEARTPAGTTRADVRLMLRALLSERFQFAGYIERRQLPSFVLTMANRDGRLGPRLRRSGPECAPIAPPPGVPLPPPPPPGSDNGFTPVLPQEPLGPTCGFVQFPGWLSGRKITMTHFVQSLTQITRRPVIDDTQLAGDFDLDVTFMPDEPVRLNGAAPPPSLAMTDRPSLLTALQEDLGLKLESQRREVEVLVIDRIERPTRN